MLQADGVRILGIDPGSRRTGVGLVECPPRSAPRWLHHDMLDCQHADFPTRLKLIFEGLSMLIRTWQPAEVAIEKVFMARNADSALKLGQARGAAICAAVAAGLPVAEYSPAEVKQAVVGGGRASKEQIQFMVGMLLKPACMPGPDAADALALALTHAHVRASLLRRGSARRR